MNTMLATMAKTVDPMAIDQQLQQTRALENQNKLADIAFQDRAAGLERAKSLGELTKNSFDPATGKLNPQTFSAGLAASGDYQGLQAFDKSQTEGVKSGYEMEAAKYTNMLKKIEIGERYASSVTDQASLDAVRQKIAQDLGPEAAAGLPKIYDRAAMEAKKLQAMPFKEQLHAKLEQIRADELARHHKAIEGTQGANKAPAGFRFTANGNLEHIPGGPADPASKAENGKPLPGAVLKVLTEARDNAVTIDNLTKSFKPGFASKGVLGLGADTSLGTSAVLGIDKDAVEWWKNYRKQAELTERHELFGASLTPGEQESWRSADIGPGMDAKVIERNLATRQALSQKMLETRRQDYIDAGHSEDKVNKIAGRGPKSDAKPPTKQVDVGGKMLDAKLAADGNYYVKQANGKYAKVE